MEYRGKGFTVYHAELLADSINPAGDRLTTFELTYPRFVHDEFMTHRMLSRNAASSRAIPIFNIIRAVETDPVVPVSWGANQKGMQAESELPPNAQFAAENIWLEARDAAVQYATQLKELGVHKQLVNRLLQPWQWITVIASATDWWHFFNLRVHAKAQPEIFKIAALALDLYREHKPELVQPGAWHLPLIQEQDYNELNDTWDLVRASAGKCARVSYVTHHGVRDLQADIALCENTLMASDPMEASPLEHPAMALAHSEKWGNYTGWKSFRKFLPNEYSNKPAGHLEYAGQRSLSG